MGRNNNRRGMARREKAAATRATIAKQYGLPDSAMVTSAPMLTGRSLFSSVKEARQHVSATEFNPEKRATFNGQRLTNEKVPKGASSSSVPEPTNRGPKVAK